MNLGPQLRLSTTIVHNISKTTLRFFSRFCKFSNLMYAHIRAMIFHFLIYC